MDANRNGQPQWWQVIVGVVSILVLLMLSLLGAALWIINTINAGSSVALGAIESQSRNFSTIQSQNDHRLTVLEEEGKENGRSQDRISAQVEKLRSSTGDLTTALQHLNDLLPERKK